MKLSVIIPCRNAEATLADALDALAGQVWDEQWEVVFADNGSTDRSVEIARAYEDRISGLRVVDASDRSGQPHALNVGVRAAHGESVAFTDADDAVGDGWVAAMGRALETHELVACRTDGTRFNKPGYQFSVQEYGVQRLWYPPFVPHVGGGTLGMRRQLFQRVGEFDHALPYLHDTDFCIRAQHLGTTIHFVPEAVVYLRNRASFAGLYRQSRNFAEYNVIVAKRYWRPGDAKLPFWLTFLRGWLGLVTGSPALLDPIDRYKVVWDLGRQVGRLKGIVKRGGVPV